ncbi:hypothetical protein FA13DRAFT_1792783 [Coprinellus micaceus]|uniref:GPN-loop GTPase 2 n=1 Tax=Coprinellus micaceus TaxID=71717 RepID=A0A4Y7T6P7_COPMI|nr:hypothetical protein FA13DRAFT_1792783 [Coprinellus micaceus]
MPFGEVVCGAPGSGKSTYCYGKYQLFTALNRPIAVVNLDPANDNIPYPCAIDISDLITLQDVMKEHGLGPNGGMLYCMEYLEANFDWLEERLSQLGPDAYVMIDLPGQVELSTNHDSMKERHAEAGQIGLPCIFATHTTSQTASKYISVLLLSLRAMLHLELPHINVLSKIDLLSNYGELGALQSRLLHGSPRTSHTFENSLNAALPPKYAALNMAMISLVEDYSLVGFETLAVEDKNSMMHLMRMVDRANGYVFVPPNMFGLFSSAAGPVQGPGSDVRDVQERWVDYKEVYDAHERKEWRKEGEIMRDQAAREQATAKAGSKIRERKVKQ